MIHSYGTPIVSATIWDWIVFEPLPMSDVPAKTSMRPSGLTLIHACDGSPFWFIPVGYSIAAKPRPVLTAISGPPGFRVGRRGAPGGGRPTAASRVIALYSGVRSCPTASAIARIVGTVDGSVYAIWFGEVSPIRFAFLSRSSYGSMPSSSAIRLMCVSVANETDVTPKPRIAVVGVRFV